MSRLFLIFVAISKNPENVLCNSTKLVTLLILLWIQKPLCAIMKRETGSVKNGEKNVTFADIAAYTGFSKTTIFRYFKAIPLRNWGRVLGELEIMYLFLMLLHLKTSGRDVVHGFKRLSGFLQKT